MSRDVEDVEDVEVFRLRARDFIRGHLRKLAPGEQPGRLEGLSEEQELALVKHQRQLQRDLFDAKLAGICFPVEYEGLGLTPAHQRAFNEEIAGYDYPSKLQAPTMAPCAAVLLDFGTEEQKQRHLPAILRGEELWMQFLSEPSSGSDVAAAVTTAVREGDEWILNGSKVWTTGAWWSDWGLCLARTNWDVPKHRGLTVFTFPIHQPGVEVHRIEMLNGSKEFCQEFLTDLRVPDSDRIGEVDAGWTVGTRWMFHERILFSSPLVTSPPGSRHGGTIDAESLLDVARDVGRLDDQRDRELIGEARTLELVKAELGQRIARGMATGAMSDQSASISRLMSGTTAARLSTIAFEIAASAGAIWSEADDGAAGPSGINFLMRQSACIAGGTVEMARNGISERVLGMPRERSHDRDLPFREIPRGPAKG